MLKTSKLIINNLRFFFSTVTVERWNHISADVCLLHTHVDPCANHVVGSEDLKIRWITSVRKVNCINLKKFQYDFLKTGTVFEIHSI